jgi:hypothetical protein
MKTCRLIEYADDPTKLVAVIKKRLKAIDRSLNELCQPETSGVEWSTVWRWETQGAKPNVATVIKLDLQLKRWEAAFRKSRKN